MSRVGKVSSLVAGLGATFLTVALVLAILIPQPHAPTDYLVIGFSSTFACLLVLAVWLQGGYRT